MNASFKVIEPKTPKEFESYFQLRWEVLRKPWGQPKGSEQDKSDSTAIHRMVLDQQGCTIGVGMLIFNSDEEAQIRFMAVSENFQGMNVGTILIDCLESVARERKCSFIVLQSRQSAIEFYKKNGFNLIKKTYLLFGEIQHFLMNKSL